MSVKVNSEITVKIGDKELKMTGIEARILIKELEKELGIENKNTSDQEIIYRYPYDRSPWVTAPIVTCGTGSGQKPNNPEDHSVSVSGKTTEDCGDIERNSFCQDMLSTIKEIPEPNYPEDSGYRASQFAMPEVEREQLLRGTWSTVKEETGEKHYNPEDCNVSIDGETVRGYANGDDVTSIFRCKYEKKTGKIGDGTEGKHETPLTINGDEKT